MCVGLVLGRVNKWPINKRGEWGQEEKPTGRMEGADLITRRERAVT